jgi:hypothetical protein
VKNASQAQLDAKGPGNLIDNKRVLTHPKTLAEFKAAGYEAPRVRYLRQTRVSKVCRYLVKGCQAAVAIDYGELKKLHPGVAGDPSFSGLHSVRWYGAYADKDRNRKTDIVAPFFTDQLDPLNDGRRGGIPDGPQLINRRTMRAEASLHFSSGGILELGNVLALVVKPALRIDRQDVDPKDTDEDAQELEGKVQEIRDTLEGNGLKPRELLVAIRQILDDKVEGTKDVNTDTSEAADGPEDNDDVDIDKQNAKEPSSADDDTNND